MTGDNCVVFLVVLTFLWTAARGDVQCIFMESCILPCSFDPGPEIVIHWVQGNKPVHSYYHNANKLSHQDKRYTGRTSLFESQILNGNVSLLLKKVEIQDRGQYKCYTSTIKGNKEQYVSVNVKAPVSEVNVEQTGDSITCSSNGIYPQPELKWSTILPSNLTIMNHTVHQTEQQVYTIRSSLLISDHSEGLEYICNVTTGESYWKATVRQQAPVTSEDSEASISCITAKTLRSLVWKFNYNQIILKKTTSPANIQYWNNWKQKVKEESESNNLILKDLSSDQQGMYTCELTTANGTYIINTFLNVPGSNQGKPTVLIAVIVIVIVIALAVAGIVAGIIHSKRKNTSSEEPGYDLVQAKGSD
ncbi:V-set domain-containing T-cell activation inhibitor 1-like isoform X2 [Sphaeramia orbicularis]|uniref:V-set domain-containing T-cell activation inhibitor 1-like isoform X2 n=1 Tax=Sphaeramia orbicularis TaxID=375764 RepID=UPI00118129D0|nr:V-set domain-containing T-cell activation inhibitor 1-like isoform X2 [Sphaeramia orbicularis]